jgi:hypothetical protein
MRISAAAVDVAEEEVGDFSTDAMHPVRVYLVGVCSQVAVDEVVPNRRRDHADVTAPALLARGKPPLEVRVQMFVEELEEPAQQNVVSYAQRVSQGYDCLAGLRVESVRGN